MANEMRAHTQSRNIQNENKVKSQDVTEISNGNIDNVGFCFFINKAVAAWITAYII